MPVLFIHQLTGFRHFQIFLAPNKLTNGLTAVSSFSGNIISIAFIIIIPIIISIVIIIIITTIIIFIFIIVFVIITLTTITTTIIINSIFKIASWLFQVIAIIAKNKRGQDELTMWGGPSSPSPSSSSSSSSTLSSSSSPLLRRDKRGQDRLARWGGK